MAIYSCNISNVSRASGSTSCATLSYITGKKIHDERLGKDYDYGRKERVLESKTMLPEHAPEAYKNPEKLFNSIEEFEKASNARTAKKIMVAMPKEFDLDTQRKVLDNYIKENINAKGYACTYAIHTDTANVNPHAHILIANRQINEKGEWGSKRKMQYALDENGKRIPQIDKETGLQKVDKNGRKQWKRINAEVNPLDKKETLMELRKEWAKECNKHLEPELQIDARSHQERGLETSPTIHEGYAAREMEKRGQASERCQINREIKSINEEIEKLNHRQKLYEKFRAYVVKELKNLYERVTRYDLGRTANDRTGKETGRAGTGMADNQEHETADRGTEQLSIRERLEYIRSRGDGVSSFLGKLRAEERASEKIRDDKIAQRKARDVARIRQDTIEKLRTNQLQQQAQELGIKDTGKSFDRGR